MKITDITEDDQVTIRHLIDCSTAEIRLLATLTVESLKQIIESMPPGAPIDELKTPMDMHMALKKYVLTK